MAPAKSIELKEKLRELLDKGFVRPNTNMGCSGVLCFKKKGGSMRPRIDYK